MNQREIKIELQTWVLNSRLTDQLINFLLCFDWGETERRSVLQEFKNGGQQWCNSSCTLFFWGPKHIVLPKRSRWLVKPKLLLDHCVQLTRTVCAAVDERHQYSWGEEEEACCGEKTGSASLEYSYRRGFTKMTCLPYDYSWDGSNLMVKKEPFSAEPSPPPMISTSNNESLIHKCTVSKLPFLLPD